MKIVAVVPMKLNNERLPGKNTKKFDNGEPLCCYILNTLLNSKYIDEVYVYCSNESIKEFLPKGVKFLKRSTNFDTSTTSMNQILSAFSNVINADIYVLSHATSPFVKIDSIDEALEQVIYHNYDSAFAVKKIQDFLWKDGKPFNYDLTNIPRTQDLPIMYSETSGFYIFKNDIITKYNRRIGFNPYIKEASEIESIDIDEEQDFKIANAIFNIGEFHD